MEISAYIPVYCVSTREDSVREDDFFFCFLTPRNAILLFVRRGQLPSL